MSDDMPSVGHNRPPQPLTPGEVVALLDDECAALKRRAQEILDGGRRFNEANPTVTSDQIASKASDFAGQKGAIASFLAMAEATRVQNKRPFDSGAQAVQAWFRTVTDPIEALQKQIRGKVGNYLADKEAKILAEKLEQARIAAERAQEEEQRALQSMSQTDLGVAQLAAEQAEKLQQEASERPDTAVHGSLGGTSHLRRRWAFIEEESDLMALVRAVAAGKAPLKYLAFDGKAIGYAVRSERLRSLDGCVIRQVRVD